jgi:cell division protease FtsH
MAPATVTHQYLDGAAQLDCSQETAAQIDVAVKSLLDKCYAEDLQLLTENRTLLDDISVYLLEKETITGEELMAFLKPAETDTPAEEPIVETETPVEEN